jgi:hypothetical protein
MLFRDPALERENTVSSSEHNPFRNLEGGALAGADGFAITYTGWRWRGRGAGSREMWL